MRRIAVLFSVLCGWFPALGQQMSCTVSAGTPATIRSSGYTELVSDIVLTCSGGTPTAAGVAVPRFGVTVLVNSTVSSRLVAGEIVSEALLIVDEPNSTVNPTRSMLNCGAPLAPDDSPGNGGPTGQAPGQCSILSTGNPIQTYDGTAGVAVTYGTGRPNVFQGLVASTNLLIFPNVPIDPPGNLTTRRFRITGLRTSAPTLAGVGGNAVTATIGGNFATFTPSATLTVANQSGATLNPVSSASGGVNTIRVREGFANAFRPRNFASFFRNAPSLNGGDFGVDLTTLYVQNVPGATYYSEEAFNSAGRPAPPGGNPNGSPAPPNGLTFAVGNVTGGGTFASSSNLNVTQIGTVTQSGRVAFAISNLVSGYTLKAPVSVRLVQAGSATPSGIAQLVTGTDTSGVGGTVSTNRSTATLADIAVSAGAALVVYEIVYAEPTVLEDLNVPLTLTRVQAAGANPAQAPTVTTGMAPYPFGFGVSRASFDVDLPTPRFATPTSSVALNLGALGFETTSLPGGTAGVVYQQTVVARGGVPLYSFDLQSGSLPPGLNINASTGAITGTPTAGGTYNFTVRVMDAATVTATQALSISINASFSLIAPASGATNQPLRPRLSWNSVAGATAYNVYLGTDALNPASYRTVTTTFLDPTALTGSTTYYWRVEAVVPGGTVTSAIWSFSTVTTCATSLNTGPKFFQTAGGSVIINVSAPGGCAWTVTNDSAWVTLNPASGTGNGSFTITVAANSGPARLALVTVGSLNLRVMQAGNVAAPVFDDVPSSDPYFDYISLLYFNNITAGCSLTPFLYCPQNPVTRQQMAVFIVRALNGVLGTALDYNPAPYFNDMPSNSGFFPFVQRIKDINITAGCSVTPPLYCPNDGIKQEQMAVFMIRAWMQANNLTTFTFNPVPYFTDVPDTSIYFRFVQKMKELGYWNGCSATQYCPQNIVTRGEMSVMIMRAIFGAP